KIFLARLDLRARRKHACGGPSRPRADLIALDDDDGKATLPQLPADRQADNAAADNGDVIPGFAPVLLVDIEDFSHLRSLRWHNPDQVPRVYSQPLTAAPRRSSSHLCPHGSVCKPYDCYGANPRRIQGRKINPLGVLAGRQARALPDGAIAALPPGFQKG